METVRNGEGMKKDGWGRTEVERSEDEFWVAWFKNDISTVNNIEIFKILLKIKFKKPSFLKS